jgi:Ner family transcriptional regulator
MMAAPLKRPSGRVGTAPRDWHPEDIKSAVRKTGLSMEALGVLHGMHKSVTAIALLRPWPKVEAIIGARIGVCPQDIWPTRYEPDGSPKRGLYAAWLKNSARRRAANSQKPTDR